MKPESITPTNIDEYIATFPEYVQNMMQELRSTIQRAAPDATEKISWGMPTFYLNRNLVHFAAYKKHIGFYPGASAIELFKEKLDEYKTSKGAIQFSINKPLPVDLITQIVKYRVEENLKTKSS
ncbi:iron chaperone [Dysgonomonas sp. ZJ279]|uniref:iron chaperone n=1 Tax=Dysgonomonas sp. ZJ279 TaxID=2709796 RepID=UPI0013ED5F97|nr:DUF1801 domain-containing protein [Dysgonomonas sp. ZJ279]